MLLASLTDYYVHLRYLDHKGIILYPKRPKRRVTPAEKPTAVLTVDKRGRTRLHPTSVLPKNPHTLEYITDASSVGSGKVTDRVTCMSALTFGFSG